MSRRPIVIGNWKMHGSIQANETLLEALKASWRGVHEAEVAVCPPFVYLAQVIENLGQSSNIGVGAQNVSSTAEGAFTGDISAAMLAELGCQYVIIGHSERRKYHGESDQQLAKKFALIQQNKMIPVLCVGETRKQREADQTLNVVGEQLQAIVEHCGEAAMAHAIVAYEPVWAIGTGLTASPAQAQDVHHFIRSQLGNVGNKVRILYGGSVKPSNAVELFAQTDIDGGLIGGASLQAEDFLAICQAAE